MTRLMLHYDFRAPDFAASPASVYAAAVEQTVWGDGKGFDRVVISSHHGCDDNYGPAPLIAASAFAVRTRRIRIAPVLAMPLYHPLRVAEEVAVLDLISEGRIDLILGAGYRPSEFAMFGQSMQRRGALMDEGLIALRQAWTGERFDFRGESVLVRPRPYQRPGPPLIMAGDSAAAARRAARLADSYMPMLGSNTYDIYVQTCQELGRIPAPAANQPASVFLHVTDDPERAWAQLEPYLLHVSNSYYQWLSEAGRTPVYKAASNIQDLKAGGSFLIVTPDECIKLGRGVDTLMFDPLFGGMPPDLGWSSLELAAEKVFPALGTDPITTPAGPGPTA
jgi:alkanesulfonate monooxygenase SsuD/methylene tetrahydromethanopterin reductase-like flavin-dependent oxidoreductase (luciferase family)